MHVKSKATGGGDEQTEKETKAEEAKTTGAARALAAALVSGNHDHERQGVMNKKIIPAGATKGLGDRTFRFTISTGDVDREGDRIDPQGWDLTAFKQNPVTLWAHNHTIPPIARTTDIGVVADRLQAVVQFPPPGVHPFADQVHDLLAKGFLSSASVGFRPIRKTLNPERGGWDFHEQELLEWSIVGIPALPQAAIQRAGVGVNRELVTKWCVGGQCGRSDLIMRIGDTGTIEVDPQALQSTLRAGLRELRESIDTTIRRTVAQAPMRMTKGEFGRECAHALREHLDAGIKEGVRVAFGRARGDIDFF